MRKRIGWTVVRWALMGTLAVCAAIEVYRMAPRPVSERISAVQFHLGANHHIRRVTVLIHGHWRYTLVGENRRFHGTIAVDGPREGNPYDYKHRTLTTTLYPFGGGALVWLGSRRGQPWTFTYGSLFASRNFRRITIWVSNSLFIAGPATTRVSGFRIANRVMRAFLGRTILR